MNVQSEVKDFRRFMYINILHSHTCTSCKEINENTKHADLVLTFIITTFYLQINTSNLYRLDKTLLELHDKCAKNLKT
jgi:hypothetical protein